jgi:hypothetical protein
LVILLTLKCKSLLTRSMDSKECLTSEPVRPGVFDGVMPEFGRTRDVELMFGLRRGTLYNLLGEKRVRAILLRVKGTKSGVRLWNMQSIRSLLNSQLHEQSAPQDK